MTHLVGPELDGERADKVVARVLGESRSTAKRLVEEGRVRMAGRPVAPAERIAAGSLLEIEPPRGPEGLQPEEVPFAVRYEDEAVAVVDKPAGMVVHPGAGRGRGTLAAGLLGRWPELRGVGEEGRWGLVHRLDRDTSGLLVVALTPESHRVLQEQLRRREVERRYLALAHGAFELATGTIDAPLGRHPRQPTRRGVVAGGRPARTHYRRLAWWERPGVTLCEIGLETGRTHQIRVHLAAIGHPLVGDGKYGRPGPPAVDPGRVWLHAAGLAFDHPAGGGRVEVTSPLPADLRGSLEALGPPAGGSLPDG